MSVLVAKDLSAGYGEYPVVHGLDLEVEAGQVVALLGPNGAGKTTTLLTLAGAIAPMSGTVSFLGASKPDSLHGRARRGLGFISESRSVFMDLTVEENLKVSRGNVPQALELFPELKALLGKKAGLMSGGEQQMLSLARALSRSPKLLLIDELSLGLAPLVVERLLDEVRRSATELGVAVVLVEQHISQALRRADDAIVLRRGRVSLRGAAAELRSRSADIQAAYLSQDEAASA